MHNYLFEAKHPQGACQSKVGCIALNHRGFVVRYNDFPHGRFGVRSEDQTLVVLPVNQERKVHLNMTRYDGSHGRVRVSYTLVYDQVVSSLLIQT